MYCIAPAGALEKNKWPRATELWSLSGHDACCLLPIA